MIRTAFILAAVLSLAACGEKPQTSSGAKRDTPAYQGTSNPYSAPGWTAGDKARGQNSQNEYNRVNYKGGFPGTPIAFIESAAPDGLHRAVVVWRFSADRAIGCGWQQWHSKCQHLRSQA